MQNIYAKLDEGKNSEHDKKRTSIVKTCHRNKQQVKQNNERQEGIMKKNG